MNFLGQVQESVRVFDMSFSHHLADFAFFLRTHYSPLYVMLAALFFMLLLRFSKPKRVQLATPSNEISNQHFIPNTESISGDNPLATKLDLAKAYIEMDKKHLAKSILLNVQKQGTEQQKQEAKKLFDSL